MEDKKTPLYVIISILGVVGIIALYFFIPTLRILDGLMMLIIVGFVAFGSTQDIVSGVASNVILYLSSGIAVLLYGLLAPYISTMLQPLGRLRIQTTIYDALAISFLLITAIVWVVLETLNRILLAEADLPEAGILDALGGAITYLAVGVLVATLMFNAIGYSNAGRPAHHRAHLRPTFNTTLYLHYTAQSFWFSGEAPAIYAYDLR